MTFQLFIVIINSSSRIIQDFSPDYLIILHVIFQGRFLQKKKALYNQAIFFPILTLQRLDLRFRCRPATTQNFEKEKLAADFWVTMSFWQMSDKQPLVQRSCPPILGKWQEIEFQVEKVGSVCYFSKVFSYLYCNRGKQVPKYVGFLKIN